VSVTVFRTSLRLRSASVVWVFHDVPNTTWFKQCIDEIASTREVLPLSDLARNPNHPKACAITFDDGLRSVFDVARPVLREQQLPYTVFVCTDVLVSGPVPWFMRTAHLIDRLGLDKVQQRWNLDGRKARSKRNAITALKEIPFDLILEGLADLEEQHAISPPNPRALFMSDEEVRTLADDGARIGSHTHRHPILSLMSVQEQRLEVEESAKLIQSITGRRPTEFAYPNGTPLDFDEVTIAVVRGSGFAVAVTTTPRHLSPADDPLALPRIGLDQGDSPIRRGLKNVAPSLSMSYRRERRRASR
jgi:peptidoglycan/xylan/chitin deacetylase (PgdA/CDA1 family)